MIGIDSDIEIRLVRIVNSNGEAPFTILEATQFKSGLCVLQWLTNKELHWSAIRCNRRSNLLRVSNAAAKGCQHQGNDRSIFHR